MTASTGCTAAFEHHVQGLEWAVFTRVPVGANVVEGLEADIRLLKAAPSYTMAANGRFEPRTDMSLPNAQLVRALRQM